MAGGTICFIEKGFTVRVPELRSSTKSLLGPRTEPSLLSNQSSFLEGGAFSLLPSDGPRH